MSNVKLIHTLNDGDLIIDNGTICTDGGLETAVYLSLFGGNDSGAEWWGNIGENDPDKQYISETQRLLVSLPLTSNNLRRLVNAIKRDLNWLDAEKDITVEVIGLNRIKISIKFSADTTVEFAVNWGVSENAVEPPTNVRFDPTLPEIVTSLNVVDNTQINTTAWQITLTEPRPTVTPSINYYEDGANYYDTTTGKCYLVYRSGANDRYLLEYDPNTRVSQVVTGDLVNNVNYSFWGISPTQYVIKASIGFEIFSFPRSGGIGDRISIFSGVYNGVTYNTSGGMYNHITGEILVFLTDFSGGNANNPHIVLRVASDGTLSEIIEIPSTDSLGTKAINFGFGISANEVLVFVSSTGYILDLTTGTSTLSNDFLPFSNGVSCAYNPYTEQVFIADSLDQIKHSYTQTKSYYGVFEVALEGCNLGDSNCTSNILNTINVMIVQDGSDWQISGELIKTILNLYAIKTFKKVVENYLDYVYGVTGDSLNVEIDRKSFSDRGLTDNFSVTLSDTFTLSISNDVFTNEV